MTVAGPTSAIYRPNVPPAYPGIEAMEAARFVRNLGFAALALTGVVAVYASLELRPLFLDAVHYLVGILREEDYVLSAPARRMVEWIRQTPVLIAIRLGVTDPGTFALVLSFSFALTPILLTALSWVVLPRDKKWFFIFPLLHFCAGTLAGIFSAQQEGFTAAAVFWLLFFYLLFRTTHTRAVNIMIGVSLPTVVLHEAMLFLAPVLALAALVRARQEPSRGERNAFVLLAVWFAIVALIQIDFIANPKYAGHGAGFARNLLNGGWLIDRAEVWELDNPRGVNLSAGLGVISLVLVALLALLGLRRKHPPDRFGWCLVAGFGLAAAGALAWLAATGRMLDMQPQFSSRNHCLIFSLPLALVALCSYGRPKWVRASVLRHAAALCAVMAVSSAIWQFHGVREWSRSLAVFRSSLAEGTGFIAWESVLANAPPARRNAMRAMFHPWVIPSMSVILSPRGKVTAIIGRREPLSWQPFDPTIPANLPKSRFWDMTAYRAALARQTPTERPPQ